MSSLTWARCSCSRALAGACNICFLTTAVEADARFCLQVATGVDFSLRRLCWFCICKHYARSIFVFALVPSFRIEAILRGRHVRTSRMCVRPALRASAALSSFFEICLVVHPVASRVWGASLPLSYNPGVAPHTRTSSAGMLRVIRDADCRDSIEVSASSLRAHFVNAPLDASQRLSPTRTGGCRAARTAGGSEAQGEGRGVSAAQADRVDFVLLLRDASPAASAPGNAAAAAAACDPVGTSVDGVTFIVVVTFSTPAAATAGRRTVPGAAGRCGDVRRGLAEEIAREREGDGCYRRRSSSSSSSTYYG